MPNQLSLFSLALVGVIPFLNFARYSPMQDWWTNALTIGLISVSILLTSWHHRRMRKPDVVVPWFFPGFIAWWLLIWAGSLWRYQQHQIGMLPLELFGLLFAAVGAVVFATLKPFGGRQRVVTVLAWALFTGSIIQTLIGLVQLGGWAPYAEGWLLYSDRIVMGNVGQRNQFAHLLTWGMLALAYLWAGGRLQTLPAMLFGTLLALMIAWSAGRLPIAYAMTILLAGVLWSRQESAHRMGIALIWVAVAILSFQIVARPIGQWLFQLEITSGLDRFGEAGFGARRRIEWAKCWEIIKAFPWLGTGFGGYGYQSVWLETFGGLPRVPESSLFTHSHNLLTQLAAETGVPATLLAVVVVTRVLWPYCQRQHATADNAFLLMVACTTIWHSMFEYPLWYLPFSFVFMVVLGLSPTKPIKLKFRSSMCHVGGVLLAGLALSYVAKGAMVFPLLVESQNPSRDIARNQQQIEQLLTLSANPFWRFESELMLSNFLVPSPEQLTIKLKHHEDLVAYRPYPMLLCKLATLQQWAGQNRKAQDSLHMLIAAYPVDISRCAMIIASARDAKLQPLLDMMAQAVLIQQKHGDFGVVSRLSAGLPIYGPHLPTTD